MKNIATIIAASAFMLNGCFFEEEPIIDLKKPDQCLRAQLFKECLQTVPAGPQTAGKYNDWDEVVNACESSSYYQSIRKESQIKPECRP